jgi:hypothetical protein
MASTTKTIQDAKEKINQWIIEDNEAWKGFLFSW